MAVAVFSASRRHLDNPKEFVSAGVDSTNHSAPA